MNAANQTSVPLSKRIDDYSDVLGNATRARLARLEDLSEQRLERIMFEAWQVSVHNPPILWAAAETTRKLAEPGVHAELMRNYAEEESHADMYRDGLAEIGSDVEKRTPWPASKALFERIGELVAVDPSLALGAMYASEAVALFESELLLDIAREVIRRRDVGERGRPLECFHEMHLGGVEQGHKNGLADFLEVQTGSGESRIDSEKVWLGAVGAIDAIATWWSHLLDTPEASLTSAPQEHVHP